MPPPHPIPRTADTVARPRLFALLDKGLGRGLVLVTGQAAQGKSTLVASYLEHRQAPCLWFHLTPQSSDYVQLFYVLADGLTACLSEKGKTAGARFDRTTLGTREDLDFRVRALARLADRLDREMTLVLDDLESLDETGAAFVFIQEAVRETRGKIRWFLLSRSLPPIRPNPLKMEQEFLVIGNEDLAFDPGEAAAFFGRHLPDSRSVDEKDIRKILAVTDGWAGGLVLVYESLRRTGSLDRLPRQLSADAFSYFSREIYRTLPANIRHFLIKTAIFEHLDTKVLDRCFTAGEAETILGELERRNLFIQKIEADGGRTVFKYNHLFRDFLRQDAAELLAPEETDRLNARAGRAFLAEGRLGDAVRHFSAAKDRDAIEGIICRNGVDYLITGRVELLLEWIGYLEEERVARESWLIFFAAMCRRIRGGKKNITDFQKALDLFETSGELRGIILCSAYLIEAGVFIREPSQRIEGWIQKGEALLERIKGSTRYTWARTVLWQQIGLGYIAGTGDIPRGISACQNAVLLAGRISNNDLTINSTVVMTLGLVQSGDFVRARQMLEKIQALAGEGEHPEYRALNRMTNIDLALKKGEFHRAKDLLEKSEADIEKLGLIFLYPGFVEARALYFAGTGDFNQAFQAADHLSDFSILEGNDFYLGISHRIKAHIHLKGKNYEQALHWADRAIDALGRSRRGDIHLFLARQIRGMSLFFMGDATAANGELASVLAYFDTISADQLYSETAFVAGLAAGEKQKANRLFDIGFRKAVAGGYTHFPLLNPPDLARILVFAATLDPTPEANFDPGPGWLPWLALLDRSLIGDDLRAAVAGGLGTATGKRQARRIEMLAPLYKWSLPRIEIRALGEFRVLAGGKTLDNARFGGAKPRALLKALVLNGCRDVPREILIDTLWPDAGKQAGEKNFKINLHRLRKALEPEPDKHFGHSYILLKSGLVTLDATLVSLDIDRFLDLAARGADLEARNRPEQALDLYTRAARLYRGDYFSEDPYLEWVFQRRELFRTKYFDILKRKALIHEDLNQWEAAVETWQAILNADPLHESAYRNLMILYADANRKAFALAVFHSCRALLKKELDTEPDAQTLAVYEKIKAM